MRSTRSFIRIHRFKILAMGLVLAALFAASPEQAEAVCHPVCPDTTCFNPWGSPSCVGIGGNYCISGTPGVLMQCVTDSPYSCPRWVNAGYC